MRSSLRSHEIVAEPFLIVGILAGIKEIVVLSVEAATLLDKGPDFSRAVVEIGVLGGVVLVLALAAFVLRERRRDTADAREGGGSGTGSRIGVKPTPQVHYLGLWGATPAVRCGRNGSRGRGGSMARMSFAYILSALMIAVAACSGGERGATTPRRVRRTAARRARTVALITHQAPGDTFWDLVRRGAEAAAAKDDVELQYSHDPDAAAQANLVRSAVSGKVAGIAVTLAVPAVMAPAVQAAIAAGIPVMAVNSGITDWKALGVMGYFGQDEMIAGQAAGDASSRRRAQRLCVIHEPGHVDSRRDDGLARDSKARRRSSTWTAWTRRPSSRGDRKAATGFQHRPHPYPRCADGWPRWRRSRGEQLRQMATFDTTLVSSTRSRTDRSNGPSINNRSCRVSGGRVAVVVLHQQERDRRWPADIDRTVVR